MKRIKYIGILCCSMTCMTPWAMHALSINECDEYPEAIGTGTLESPAADDDPITLIRGTINANSYTPITLTRSGVYRLSSPLTATGSNTALTIAANNVTLDLDGNTISGGATGIIITGTNVTVKNGTVQNTSATGITVSGSNCHINAVDVVHSSTGFLVQNSTQNVLANCRALQNTSAGFSLVSSSTNSITNCRAINTNGDAHSAYGFISQSGYGNMFDSCTAQNTQTAATQADTMAAGYLLLSEQKCTLMRSQALNTLSLTTTAAAYGITTQDMPTANFLNVLDNVAVGSPVRSAAWSPDGRYLAVGTAAQLHIYAYHANNYSLHILSSVNIATSLWSVSWSPDGAYLAVGQGLFLPAEGYCSIYAWNGSTLEHRVTTEDIGCTLAVAWSPDGRYIACNRVDSWTYLRIYSWNNPTLTYVDEKFPAISSPYALTWLTNGTLVTGGEKNLTYNLYAYSFNGTTLDGGTPNTIGTGIIRSIARAPTDNVISIGSNDGNTYIYAYNGTTLTPITNATHGALVLATAWSSDGKNLAIGGSSSSGIYIHRYLWQSNTLIERDTASTPPGASVYGLSYSSSNVLASGSATPGDGYQLRIWGIVHSDVIQHNQITGTTNAASAGVGINGATGQYIAANTAYANDINYQYVASEHITSQANARGVYNTDSDNTVADTVEVVAPLIPPLQASAWSIESKCELINSELTIFNAALAEESWSIESKCEVISSKIDPVIDAMDSAGWNIESKAEMISSSIDPLVPIMYAANSKVDVMLACPATPIITSGTITGKSAITGATTITQPGSYCLGCNIGNSTTGASLTLSAANITLDLNGYTIDCDSTQATGITISSDANNATVSNGKIQNATTNGVSLAANNCTLENIDVISSPTGFYMNDASYNALTNCRALNCTQNGFYLSACQKNRLTECAALNVGGSTSASNVVTGFVAQNGQENSFDGCSVINAHSDYASATGAAQGMRLIHEDYDTIINCSINGVSTTQTTIPNIPALYGIRAPLTNVQSLSYTDPDLNTTAGNSVSWLEYKGTRYLAVGCSTGANKEIQILTYDGNQLTRVAAADWPTSGTAVTVNSVAWLVSTTSDMIYLAIGSNRNDTSPGYEVQIYLFTPPNTLTVLPSAGFAVSSDTGTTRPYVQQVDWLSTCTSGSTHYYLASAAERYSSVSYFSEFYVHEFDGSTLTPRASKTISSSYGQSRTQWLSVGTKAYLAAAGSNGTLHIYEFIGNDMPLRISTTELTGAPIQALSWLSTNNGKYCLAVGVGTGVFIFDFDPYPTTPTLSQVASYNGSGSVTGLSWLPGIDCLSNLAVSRNQNGSEVQIVRFDGQCLTPIYAYADPTATQGLSCDWLTTNSTILAAGTAGGSTTVRTLGFSPTRNLIKDTFITDIRGGISTKIDTAAFAVDGNNLMVNNIAYNNDNNYYYEPQYGDANQGLANGQAAPGT